MEQYQSAEKNQESRTNVSTAGKISIEAKSDREIADKELMKMLRRPRSKKYMKALKNIDLLSAGDEMIIEQLKREAGIDPMEEMTFQPEDIEKFKKKISETLEDERNPPFTLAPCSIVGCVAHAIDSKGDVLQHYTELEVRAMGEAHKRAYELISEYENWSYVEVRRSILTHRSLNGDTIKIYKLDE